MAFKKPSRSARPPQTKSWTSAQEAARRCLVCPFARHSTQTVFGLGPSTADLVVVGECPGDREDLEGKPFVGPAGRLLRKMLEEVGLPAERVYLTNAVKHFKFTRRGKKRLHAKPDAAEIQACRPWLELELQILKPKVILALGSTAVKALFGRTIPIGKNRGRWWPYPSESRVLMTWHPSAVLRAKAIAKDTVLEDQLKADLRQAVRASRALKT